MLVRTVAVAIAVLAGAASATAQQKGTLEFGGFGSSTAFDNSFGVNRGWGGGGRVGVFFSPRLSVELEANGISSDRPFKAHEFNVGQVSGRLLGVPLKAGRLSVLLGAGLERTDTYFLESYGVHGLLGAKVGLMNNVDLRIDGLQSYMFDGGGTNRAIRVGFSVYRQPRGLSTTNTVNNTPTNTVVLSAPLPAPQRPDSVSAAETRRLRALEANYRTLRDSLGAPSTSASASSAESATMREMIYFPHDVSDLSAAAKTILTDKVTVFRSNPSMRISIVGFASQPGTNVYNMALGLRRAEAAKAYLVSQGINASRIEIATRGEGQLIVEGPGEVADAQNRRGQFSILITEQP